MTFMERAALGRKIRACASHMWASHAQPDATEIELSKIKVNGSPSQYIQGAIGQDYSNIFFNQEGRNRVLTSTNTTLVGANGDDVIDLSHTTGESATDEGMITVKPRRCKDPIGTIAISDYAQLLDDLTTRDDAIAKLAHPRYSQSPGHIMIAIKDKLAAIAKHRKTAEIYQKAEQGTWSAADITPHASSTFTSGTTASLSVIKETGKGQSYRLRLESPAIIGEHMVLSTFCYQAPHSLRKGVGHSRYGLSSQTMPRQTLNDLLAHQPIDPKTLGDRALTILGF